MTGVALVGWLLVGLLGLTSTLFARRAERAEKLARDRLAAWSNQRKLTESLRGELVHTEGGPVIGLLSHPSDPAVTLAMRSAGLPVGRVGAMPAATGCGRVAPRSEGQDASGTLPPLSPRPDVSNEPCCPPCATRLINRGGHWSQQLTAAPPVPCSWCGVGTAWRINALRGAE